MNTSMTSQLESDTIMVVDDNSDNLHLLSDILQAYGYRVKLFPSGKYAIEAAINQPPEMILLDVMMPDMSGFDVCKIIKNNPLLSDIPIIFISALSDVHDKVRAFREGGVDYITKPFQEEEVLQRIATHLTLRKLQKELKSQNNHLELKVFARTRDLHKAQALAKIGSWDFIFESKEIKCSPQTYRIFNISVDQSAELTSYYHLIHPDDKITAIEQWKKVKESGSLKMDIRIKIQEQEKWLRILAEVEYHEEGWPIRLQGTIQDIHESKLMELEIRKFSEIIEQSPTGIQVLDHKGVIQYVNNSFTKITGYRYDDVVNTGYYHNEAQEGADVSTFLESIKGKKAWKGEVIKQSKTGENYWERSVVFPVRNGKGEVMNYAAIIEDITEYKETEKKLKESEKRFRTLFYESKSIIYLLDGETGNFVDVNPACQKFYGLTKDELLNRHVNDLNGRGSTGRLDIESIKREKQCQLEYSHVTAQGVEKFMVSYCGEITLNGKKLIHVISHDITDRVEYFNKLKEQNDILKEIAWTQSHIVRAPVARLMGLTELFNESDFGSLSLHEIIIAISDSAKEIDDVIKKISNDTGLIQLEY